MELLEEPCDGEDNGLIAGKKEVLKLNLDDCCDSPLNSGTSVNALLSSKSNPPFTLPQTLKTVKLMRMRSILDRFLGLYFLTSINA